MMDTKVSILIALALLVSIDAAPQEGEIRVVNGQGQHQGNVQIYHAGKWGGICDDGWVINNAAVICGMLGYRTSLGYTKNSYFGKLPDDMDFWLDDVRCYGTEANILDCDHRQWGQNNCDKREAAGVYCDKSSKTDRYEEATGPEETEITITRSSTTRNGVTSQSTTAHTTRTSTQQTTTPSEQPRRTTAEQPRRTTPKTRPEVRRRTNRPNDNAVQNDERQRLTTVRTPKVPRRTTTRNGIGVQRRAKNAKWRRKLRNGRPKKTTGAPKKPNKPVKPTKKPITRKPNRNYNSHNVPHYDIRLMGGRAGQPEGRVEIRMDGKWGVICSDNWDLREAMVVCRQAGLNYAQAAIDKSHFGGQAMNKFASGIQCDGDEKRLSRCFHKQVGPSTECYNKDAVAGVICADRLPDLIPNATLLMQSAYLQDLPMYYLQCAMEEGCAASTAYTIKQNSPGWASHPRRLLRFSSSTWNFGTADFRPFMNKNDWEWHDCHMHYHSMEVFAHYDILDLNHNRVAEGHKASFCLEDVQCLPGHSRKYRCVGYGEQGISVGCADDYLHDIDCQWIDITDLEQGEFIFRVHINPEYKVAELSFDNNAVTCELSYTGYNVFIKNCKVGSVPRRSRTNG